MRTWMLCMATGIGLVAFLPYLPPLWICAASVASTSVACLWPGRNRSRFFNPALAALALCCGVCWGTWYGSAIARQLLPAALEQRSLLLSGRIDSLVDLDVSTQRDGSQRRLARWSLRVDSCAACVATLPRVLLSAYDLDIQPRGGERWQLRVKLKRPRGFANPGGFDYEGWLVAQRIGAVGYVEASIDNRRLAPAPWWSVARWRADFKDYLDARLQDCARRDLLLGLLIGDGAAIDQRSWETLRATGTVHLFVVSGLQIAFSGGALLWLGRLWWRSPWGGNRRRDYWLGIVPALLAATLYALLAGFGLPIQRALIMFAVFAAALAMRREIGVDAWVLALALVLLSNPLAVLDAGFWFSFAAVAVILAALHGVRSDAPSQGWRWLRVQLALFATSLPLMLAATGQFTLLALPANAIAVPWTTALTTPLIFAALPLDAIAPAWARACWRLADLSLVWLWRYLDWLQRWSGAGVMHPAGLGAPSLFCSALCALLYLLPRGTPGRAWALLLLLPLGWPRLEPIAPGACRVTAIDVGQGLSVLVQTSTHTLLYDAGPLFGPERTVAELTVLPLLQQRGIDALDAVVISHKDSDHAGGWPTVAAHFAVAQLLIGEPLPAIGQRLQSEGDSPPLAASKRVPTAQLCTGDMRWRWDAVEFAILYPPSAVSSAAGAVAGASRGNNRSCVLRIDAGGASIILPGDIERGAERILLADDRLRPATVLLAPHHGSRSSSTDAFVERVAPRYVVFSTGYLNRFKHPHPSVVERYRQHGAQLFDTADSGAITFEIRDGAVQRITRQRALASHYWQLAAERAPP